LREKQKRARQIQKLLKESTDDTIKSGRWMIVREEIEGSDQHSTRKRKAARGDRRL
jgi:hypothetical protein